MAEPSPTGSIEALQRVRSAETEADERLAAARRLAEETLLRLRNEAEDAVSTARAEAEGERVHGVETARAQAEREAAAIVADGERVAARLDRDETIPSEKRATVLAAVLGDLAGK
jgi:V/A-type H+-transporting ATPase subunit G/H